MQSNTFTMLAQDGLGDMLYPIAILVMALLSWIGGKLKQAKGPASPPPAGRAPARYDDDADAEEPDDDTRVIDLAELLGIRQAQRPDAPSERTTAPPQPPALAVRPAPVARPAQSVPPPRAPQRTPAPPVDLAPALVAIDLALPHELVPAVAPRPAVAARSRRASRRLGLLTRADLRRAIILNEILGKPLALRDASAENRW